MNVIRPAILNRFESEVMLKALQRLVSRAFSPAVPFCHTTSLSHHFFTPGFWRRKSVSRAPIVISRKYKNTKHNRPLTNRTNLFCVVSRVCGLLASFTGDLSYPTFAWFRLGFPLSNNSSDVFRPEKKLVDPTLTVLPRRPIKLRVR